jgi:hypothetical protein
MMHVQESVNFEKVSQTCFAAAGLLGCTVCTHKHRHPPAPCEQGFSPENVACLSVLGQKN